VPGVYPFKLGDFTITVLSDGTSPGSTYAAVEYEPNRNRSLQKNFLTNPVETSINAFLIDTGVDKYSWTQEPELFGPKLGGSFKHR